MYKLKVERTFNDRLTGELHKAGETLIVEDARGEELLASPHKVVSHLGYEVPAEAIEEVDEDGNVTPLIEEHPELKGETVEVPAKEKPKKKNSKKK